MARGEGESGAGDRSGDNAGEECQQMLATVVRELQQKYDLGAEE
jgi:hypothetical protein